MGFYATQTSDICWDSPVFFFKNWDLNADLCLLEVMTHFCVDFPKNESPIFILVRGIRISQDGQDVRSYYTFTSLECKILINVFWPSLRHWFYLSLSGLWYHRKINELSRFSFFSCIVLKAGKCMLENEYKWSVGKSLGCWWWPITAVLCHHTRYVWYGSPRLIAFDASSCFVDMHE